MGVFVVFLMFQMCFRGDRLDCNIFNVQNVFWGRQVGVWVIFFMFKLCERQGTSAPGLAWVLQNVKICIWRYVGLSVILLMFDTYQVYVFWRQFESWVPIAGCRRFVFYSGESAVSGVIAHFQRGRTKRKTSRETNESIQHRVEFSIPFPPRGHFFCLFFASH